MLRSNDFLVRSDHTDHRVEPFHSMQKLSKFTTKQDKKQQMKLDTYLNQAQCSNDS